MRGGKRGAGSSKITQSLRFSENILAKNCVICRKVVTLHPLFMATNLNE